MNIATLRVALVYSEVKNGVLGTLADGTECR